MCKATSGQCDYITLHYLFTLHYVDTFVPYLGCIYFLNFIYLLVNSEVTMLLLYSSQLLLWSAVELYIIPV